MNIQECCNHNCNQGRDCPLRKKELADDEIWKLWVKHLNDDIVVFARAILRKAQEK
jgi:hypothetical protein